MFDEIFGPRPPRFHWEFDFSGRVVKHHKPHRHPHHHPHPIRFIFRERLPIVTNLQDDAPPFTLGVTVKDAKGNVIPDDQLNLEWSIDDTTIATLSSDSGTSVTGTLTGELGTFTITVTDTEGDAKFVGSTAVNVVAGPVAEIDIVLTPGTTPVNPPNPPNPPAPPVDEPTQPVYTFTGDASTIDTTAWTLVPFTDANGNQLYTFSGDAAGSGLTGTATGNGADNGAWTVYLGALTPVTPAP